MAENEVNFEKAISDLQTTVKKLESGELSLEDSLKAFEEGIKLTRVCQEHLNKAEKKIEVLSQIKGDGEITTKPFPSK
jgi:exodeoxyribonuclease VII small subunit